VAEALDPGSFVYLEVEDTGSGMDRETQARIFDPFFTTKFTGRGLGLAAMQGIVRGHGGGVEIRSSPGEGTLFRVYLPVREGTPPPEPAERPTVARKQETGAGLVLVVDDEAGIREFAQHVLGEAGFEVLLARDGVEAVEQVRAHPQALRLVLLDLAMPRKSGEEALAEMRAMGFLAPVICWSGYTHLEGALDARSSFLHKPFGADDLLEAVQKALA
jgi:CheY-like chemotaxis protein